MRGIIVSDTSCLILLNKIGQLDLLRKVFGEIFITSIIAKEFDSKLPEFIKIKAPSDKNYQKILESFLDAGEASAIALALEQDDCLLIIDELKGRKEAKSLNMNFTGTLGVILLAKEKGKIDSVKEIIHQITRTDFRISEKLLIKTLKKSGE